MWTRPAGTPLVAAIRAWMQAQSVLPQSGLGRAIAYADGLWPGLVRFLGDLTLPRFRGHPGYAANASVACCSSNTNGLT
jgi:hypothetical protein